MEENRSGAQKMYIENTIAIAKDKNQDSNIRTKAIYELRRLWQDNLISADNATAILKDIIEKADPNNANEKIFVIPEAREEMNIIACGHKNF